MGHNSTPQKQSTIAPSGRITITFLSAIAIPTSTKMSKRKKEFSTQTWSKVIWQPCEFFARVILKTIARCLRKHFPLQWDQWPNSTSAPRFSGVAQTLNTILSSFLICFGSWQVWGDCLSLWGFLLWVVVWFWFGRYKLRQPDRKGYITQQIPVVVAYIPPLCFDFLGFWLLGGGGVWGSICWAFLIQFLVVLAFFLFGF